MQTHTVWLRSGDSTSQQTPETAHVVKTYDSAVFIKTASIHVEPRNVEPQAEPEPLLAEQLTFKSQEKKRKERNANDWQTG